MRRRNVLAILSFIIQLLSIHCFSSVLVVIDVCKEMRWNLNLMIADGDDDDEYPVKAVGG